jgi:ankyrin repeat protein
VVILHIMELSDVIDNLLDIRSIPTINESMTTMANERGETLLHWMCVYDRDDIILQLLDHGANVNRLDNVRGSPLHWAVCSNSLYIVILLLDNGAKVNISDERGWTPLHYAASKGAYGIARELIQRGANTLAVDDDCMNPTTIAILYGHMKTSRLIGDSTIKN